ncbi:MAG: DNA adenine methylase [Pseudomonadota bacterium]
MERVEPALPVAPWVGGKRILSKLIIPILEGQPHTTYVEPFVGMGGVFLRRAHRPKAEVINDLNGEIANLFRILQRHYPQLLDVMRFQIASRRDFERLRATDPSTLTDLERAVRFLYLQRLSFGGQPGGVFGVATDRPARFSLSKLEPLLQAAHERLDSVVIECLDCSEVLRRYDRPATLFYLDPPYIGSENDYGRDLFSPEQFEELVDQLRKVDGRFLLSINACETSNRLCAGFEIKETEVTYSVSKGSTTRAKELLVANFGLS